ncbi:Uncharacterized protein Rs2_28918 [Raphanus sativus]|nr:Uncharacterized protein Rs2_28918 [Raphanus sativus]
MPSGDGVGVSVSIVEGDISDGSLAKVISKISYSDVVKDGFYLWGMRLSFSHAVVGRFIECPWLPLFKKGLSFLACALIKFTKLHPTLRDVSSWTWLGFLLKLTWRNHYPARSVLRVVMDRLAWFWSATLGFLLSVPPV